jgi:hypothetical protein
MGTRRLVVHMDTKMSAQPQNGTLTALGCRSLEVEVQATLHINSALSRTTDWLEGAINKSSEDENRWLSGDGTRATLRNVSPVTQTPYQ